MKRFILAAALLALAIGQEPVIAQTADCFQGQGFVGVPAYFETLTVSTTALPLTASVYKPTTGAPASLMALMTTATDSLRFRLDGVAPTSAVGHQVAAASVIVICQASLQKFQAIRSGSVDVPLTISYFTAPQ